MREIDKVTVSRREPSESNLRCCAMIRMIKNHEFRLSPGLILLLLCLQQCNYITLQKDPQTQAAGHSPPQLAAHRHRQQCQCFNRRF